MDYNSYVHRAAVSVIAPVLVSAIATFYINKDEQKLHVPALHELSVMAYDFWSDTGYMIYTFTFFGGLAGVLISLMSYNLFLMFGLDAPVAAAQKSFLDWFTTPPLKSEQNAQK